MTEETKKAINELDDILNYCLRLQPHGDSAHALFDAFIGLEINRMEINPAYRIELPIETKDPATKIDETESSGV